MNGLIEGVCVQVIHGDVQAAIEEAGAKYRQRFDQVPTHISLPADVGIETVRLYGLQRGPATRAGRTTTKHEGTVIVGRPVADEGAPGPRQLEMFGDGR